MKKCFIITSYLSAPIRENGILIDESDFIVCADGGYHLALLENIKPHVVIGDFDSFPPDQEMPSEVLIHQYQVEKDDTDTMLCLKYGIEKGYEDFVIIGGLGGRLDHTFANLQTMAYAVHQGVSIRILDGRNKAFMLGTGTHAIEKEERHKLSLFSFSTHCLVSVSGVKYPLDSYVMRNNFPIGTSNEFIGSHASIVNHKGMLLVILSEA